MISEKDVRYIASLSRIHLRDEEVQPLTKNLEDILKFVEKLGKADTTNVQPTSHVLPLKNVFHKDHVLASLPHHEVMAIAVEKHEGSFKVPKVIE